MNITEFDSLIGPDAPAYVRRMEVLTPATSGGTVAPPTYYGGVYNLSELKGHPDRNLCTVNSVQAEANLMEEILDNQEGVLIPTTVTAAIYEGKTLVRNEDHSFLALPHRLGEGLIRYADEATITAGLQQACNGDCTWLVRNYPTAILFGMWDSYSVKGLMFKMARIIRSEVEARNVDVVTKASTYQPVVPYTSTTDEDLASFVTGLGKKLSAVGADAAGSDQEKGGLKVHGGITRQMTLNLQAIRRLRFKGLTPGQVLSARRYLLGLGLFLMVSELRGDLRSGCDLVGAGKGSRTVTLLTTGGEVCPFAYNAADTLAFAQMAAREFVGDLLDTPRRLVFDKKAMKQGIIAQCGEKAARTEKKAAGKKGLKAKDTNPSTVDGDEADATEDGSAESGS